jgi:large subunit ribosomal protein L17
MRHQKAGKKLNRTGSHRNAMFRNMVTSLFIHGKIRTTDAKAKELRRWADSVITLAKRGDLHARRQALAVVKSKDVVHKLFEEAPERFGQRAGGYTRVIKIGRRSGDAAPISLVEFVVPEKKKERKKKKPKAAKKGAALRETPAKPKEKAMPKEAETAEKAASDELSRAAKKAGPEKKKEAVTEPEGKGLSEGPEASPESSGPSEAKEEEAKE